MEVGEVSQTSLLGTINIQLKSNGIKPITPMNYPEVFKIDNLNSYIMNNYQYLDCFNYVAKGEEEENEVTFVEDVIRENIENQVKRPCEFQAVYNNRNQLNWQFQCTF
ncbi:hypothetical protein [Staphylococcus pettenkoferi]|uniref:hypothetical protein n=1 Tax=Staphylococcus pettenkoferi TaxID=170573 RepID=UPI0025573880|nr:hypothetical protein [Staphylococcus pettenkoferi]MDK7284322.1 hypothetical protein [Staphylococcus pettenkoferi]